jgi:hypothetical protein
MKVILLFVLTFLVFDLQSHTKNKAVKSTKHSKHGVEQLQQQDVIIVQKNREGRSQTELSLLQPESQDDIDFQLSVLQDLERSAEEKRKVQHVEERKAAELLASYILSTSDKQGNKIVMDTLHKQIQQTVQKFPRVVNHSCLGRYLFVDGDDIAFRHSPTLLDIARVERHIPAQASLMAAFFYGDDK